MSSTHPKPDLESESDTRVRHPKRDLEPESKSDTGVTHQKPDLAPEPKRPKTCDASSYSGDFRLRNRRSLELSHEEVMLLLKDILDEDARYLEQSRNLSCYDAIPRPAGTLLCGGSPVKPLEITEINRPSLLNFSEIALNYYNEVTCGSTFEFHDLVKCTFSVDYRYRVRHITNYYITFKAKESPDDDAITVFQAEVWVDQLDKAKPPLVKECRIKNDIHSTIPW